MTVFDVYVNGRKCCRAGVGPDGVLTAMVSWTKLIGPAAQQARRLKSPVEETRLEVGGLRAGVHREWVGQSLREGDQVTIAVRSSQDADAPAAAQPSQSRRRLRATRARPVGDTTLLNVDLDIWASTPLDRLVAAFGRRVVVLHVGREGRRYGAHLELARSWDAPHADSLIRSFVSLVRRLPPRSRALWNRAQARDFNVGIQAATAPYSYDVPVAAATLRAAAAINARLVVTVYAADVPADPPARRRRR